MPARFLPWRTRTKTRIPPLRTWIRRSPISITRSTICCTRNRRSFIPPRTTNGITTSFSRSRRIGKVFDPAGGDFPGIGKGSRRSPLPRIVSPRIASPVLQLPDEDERDDQGIDDQRLDQRETDDHRDEDLGLGGRIAGNPLQSGSDRSALAERSPERRDRYAKPGGQCDEGLDAVAHPGGSPPLGREGHGGHCYEEQCEQESEGNFAEHRIPPFTMVFGPRRGVPPPRQDVMPDFPLNVPLRARPPRRYRSSTAR